MKNRNIAVLAAVIVAAGALSAGCGKASSSSDGKSGGTNVAAEVSTNQPDPLAPTESDENADTTEAETTTEAPAEETSGEAADTTRQADPLGSGEFSYTSDGALKFDGDIEKQDDRNLIAAAQALFKSACQTEWDYTVGCPYNVDNSSYVENQYGWRYGLVTSAGINSFADVLNDYHKVFSEDYPDNLSDNYMDSNGRVYALDAARGMNIFYSTSKVTAVQSRSKDEIKFSVENYYDGTDIDGSAAYTRTDNFTVAISSDGIWRVKEFKLPY